MNAASKSAVFALQAVATLRCSSGTLRERSFAVHATIMGSARIGMGGRTHPS
jgi:hypothetical protein